MQINGRLTVCDRCGANVFSKCTCKGEADGGFTQWNEFEDLPDGWSSHFNTGDLCPKCSKEYDKLMSDFLTRVYLEGAEQE